MEFIRKFEQLRKSDAAIAGGKGASLGEMTQAGIPVPPGFVVLAPAFEQFLKETNLNVEIDAILHRVNHTEIHTVENASEEIKALILEAKMPKDIAAEIKTYFEKLNAEYVAVRSSATAEDSASAAWAGQLESYLNTTEKSLLENVKKCWASLFTPRAIFYRFEKGLHEQKISVAVVVQKMIQSEISGIAFSVHPVTQDRNQLIIEAGYGLGEAIVSGQITPDSYVVEKNPRRIIDKNISEQKKAFVRADSSNSWVMVEKEKRNDQKLTDTDIFALSNLVINIENHYGFPCDIEWAKEKGEFYIVQSRPITTLINPSLSTEKTTSLDPEIYQRLFQVGGMPYLISDIFITEYKKIKGLVILRSGIWTSYLPKNSVKETLVEGLNIYSDPTAFNEYKNNFENYKRESKHYFENLVKQKSITKSDLEKFLNLISEFFSYYRKTEFFATDEAYRYSLHDTVTKENLKHFEEIKNSGREYLNKLFFGNTSYLSQALNILEKQFAVSLDSLLVYGKDDLLSLFEKTKVPNSALADRKKAYVMSGDGKNVYYLEGDEADVVASQFERTAHEFHTEIKGAIANKGVVRGKVRVIVMDYSNFDSLKKIMNEMEKGDILVAETTSPEFMPACSKASAIITNQGGMMSHAAIISREMGIPCIVGTGNATDILKDGDLVEVDANKGIVKIIKQSFIRQYQKFFTRELALIVMEYWHKGEFEGLPKILKGATHFNPLFIRNEAGLTDTYYDINNPDTALQPLFDYFKNNPKEFDKLSREFETQQKKVYDLIENFSFKSFGELFDAMVGAWAFLPIWVQFGSVEDKTIPKDWIKKSYDLRDQFQALEYKVGDTLYNAIEKQYPKYKEFADVISFKEATSGKIPNSAELEKRKKSLIYFEEKIITGLSKPEFAKKYALDFTEDLATIGELNSKKQKFIKAYTRDFSVIMEQAWLYSNKEGLIDRLGLKSYPYNPPYIYYMKDGVVEVWENKEANHWLLDRLVEKIKTDKDFFPQVYARYFKQLRDIEIWWEKNIKSASDLKKFIDKIYSAMSDFVIIYGALMDKRIPKNIQEMAEEMRKKDKFFDQSDKAVRKGLNNIYPNLRGIEVYLVKDELGDDISREELMQRDSGFAIADKFIGPISFDRLISKFPEFEFEIDKVEHGKEIKGQTAYPGKVRGEVKILKRKNQISEVREGDIIVSSMTTPDFLPALQKAAAFITDEGGITCHAAIVARELKKPCIIGTKVATQVLKDGDWVEIDADNGLVMIL